MNEYVHPHSVDIIIKMQSIIIIEKIFQMFSSLQISRLHVKFNSFRSTSIFSHLLKVMKNVSRPHSVYRVEHRKVEEIFRDFFG